MQKQAWLGLGLTILLVACPFSLHVPTLVNDYASTLGDGLVTDLNAKRASASAVTPISCLASASNPSQFPAKTYTGTPALPTLVRDPQLDRVAHSHADFLTKRYPSLNAFLAVPDPHNGAGDGSLISRTRAAGFANSVVGEILAINFPNNAAVIAAWMSSSNGHCQNIMDADFNRVGVAKITFNTTDSYWVVVFGKI